MDYTYVLTDTAHPLHQVFTVFWKLQVWPAEARKEMHRQSIVISKPYCFKKIFRVKLAKSESLNKSLNFLIKVMFLIRWI